MPRYEYEHKSTGHRFIVGSDDKEYFDALVAETNLYRRVFSFTTARTFAAVNPHDARATPITSKQRYKDELKSMAEQESLRHGIDVTYEPVDLGNPRELGVSEKGIEEHNKKQWEKKNG